MATFSSAPAAASEPSWPSTRRKSLWRWRRRWWTRRSSSSPERSRVCRRQRKVCSELKVHMRMMAGHNLKASCPGWMEVYWMRKSCWSRTGDCHKLTSLVSGRMQKAWHHRHLAFCHTHWAFCHRRSASCHRRWVSSPSPWTCSGPSCQDGHWIWRTALLGRTCQERSSGIGPASCLLLPSCPRA